MHVSSVPALRIFLAVVAAGFLCRDSEIQSNHVTAGNSRAALHILSQRKFRLSHSVIVTQFAISFVVVEGVFAK
jgi:hypothetical protein